MRFILPALFVTISLAAAGCEPRAPVQASKDAVAKRDFAATEAEWRDARRDGLLAPDGWTSLVGLHWIDPDSHDVGSAPGNGIRLAMGPPRLGMLALEDGSVRFTPDPAATVSIDGEAATGDVALRTDGDPAGPSAIAFDAGKGKATVIERAGRLALRVRHADAPTRVQFAGLDYWPADPAWVVAGHFVPHPPGKTLEIASIIGNVDKVANPGAIEFTRDGKTFRIEALDEGEDTLFLVFADRTNGHGSYGAGRFLDVARPDAQGNVQVDFNHAYNPPCAFTPFATCPLPPPENRLDLSITAGEKAYRKSPHS